MSEQTNDLLSVSVRDFIAQTAAKTPTPGGGSVAATVGALGAALGHMALAFTRGKKKYAEHEPYYARLGPRLLNAAKMFESFAADDVAAFGLYQAASSMPDGDAGKSEAFQTALAAAVNIPRQAARLALALMDDLREFCGRCSPYLLSDLEASAALAVAVLRLSLYNVRINSPQVADKAAAADLLEAARGDLKRGISLLDEIEKAAEGRLP